MLKLIIFLRPFARYLLIVWALTIITLSSIPNIPTLKIHTDNSVIRLDYVMHFMQYGILTFLTFLCFSGKAFEINYGRVIMIMSGVIFFAVIDEFHQKLIPGRSFSLKDIVSNVSGIVVLTIFSVIIFHALRKKLATKISE